MIYQYANIPSKSRNKNLIKDQENLLKFVKKILLLTKDEVQTLNWQMCQSVGT